MRAKIAWHAIWMRVSSNRDGTYRQSWDEFASLTKVPFIWCQCGFGAAPIWSCFGSGSFARVSQRDTLCRDYLESFLPLDWRLGSGWQNWTCFGKTPLCAKSCASPWRCDAPTAVVPPELRPRRAVLWRWLEERRPCRACAVSLPCTCSSTTPSAGPNGLRAGWLISRYKPVKIFLTKTLLLWLKVKHFHSSIFFYREGFWCPCSSLFLASLWLALTGLGHLFRNQSLTHINKDCRWSSEVVFHILNFKTDKWFPLRFVAIAVATKRISLPIFLQSSIRWVR